MYELFYGLNCRPFRISPDIDCFYLSHTHKRALAHLRYGLQQAEGFVVLTGLPGTGKTLLLTLLTSELKKQNVQIARIDNALMEDADLLPAILSSFNLPIFEFQQRALVSQLEAFLLSKAALGQRSIIVIDDAQNLSPRSLEALRLLSNLQYKSHSVLQILLVGDTALEEAICGSGNHLLRQRVTLTYQINPIHLQETKNYINHRLVHAGWSADPEVKEDVYTVIHKLSGGIPGKINRLFDRLLMQGMLQKKHTLSGKDVNNLLAENGKYDQASVAQCQLPKQRDVIESVAVVEVDENPGLIDDSSTVVSELNKEFEKSEKIDEKGFQVSNKQNRSATMSILLFSYAASLLLAIALFYIANKLPLDDLTAMVNSGSGVQTMQRTTSSMAVID